MPCLYLLLICKFFFCQRAATSFPLHCIPFHPFYKWYLPSTPVLSSITDPSFQSYNGYGGYGGGGGYAGGGGWGEDRMSNLGGGLRSVDWASTKLEHFEKNFYVEDKRVSARSEREIDDFKRSKEIKVGYTVFSLFSF